MLYTKFLHFNSFPDYIDFIYYFFIKIKYQLNTNKMKNIAAFLIIVLVNYLFNLSDPIPKRIFGMAGMFYIIGLLFDWMFFNILTKELISLSPFYNIKATMWFYTWFFIGIPFLLHGLFTLDLMGIGVGLLCFISSYLFGKYVQWLEKKD